jgi:benzoyl-CoA reductase/2-hydroxyglutaryl-CoA dehydratase subunit BcrC/BadD/HgdB
LGIVPRADVSIGFHTFCDDAPLVDQLIREWDGTEVCNPYRVRDIHFTGDPFDEENIKYFADSLRDGHRQLEELLDIKITPEYQAKARELFVNLSATIFAPMTGFMKADPVPLNANDLAYALLPVATAFDTGYDRIFEA